MMTTSNEHNNAPAVPQGEPVACLVRQRTLRTRAAIAHDGKDHFSEWSDWSPATLKYGTAVTDPRRNSGPEHLFEMLPLVLATPAPAPAQEVALKFPVVADPMQLAHMKECFEYLKAEVGTKGWVEMDFCNYMGFFMWGFDAARQSYAGHQPAAPAQEAMQSFTVPDDLPGMWGHSDLTGGETDCANPAQERCHLCAWGGCMSYTPEIMKVCVVDESGEAVATLEWMDSDSIDVTLNGCCTNSKDWQEVSDAIQAAIIKMEQSTADHQRKVST